MTKIIEIEKNRNNYRNNFIKLLVYCLLRNIHIISVLMCDYRVIISVIGSYN